MSNVLSVVSYFFSTLLPPAFIAFIFNLLLSVRNKRSEEKKEIIRNCVLINDYLDNIRNDHVDMLHGIIKIDVKGMATEADLIDSNCRFKVIIVKDQVRNNYNFFKLMDKHNIKYEELNDWLDSAVLTSNYLAEIQRGKEVVANLEKSV